jgi:hypothetical protein
MINYGSSGAACAEKSEGAVDSVIDAKTERLLKELENGPDTPLVVEPEPKPKPELDVERRTFSNDTIARLYAFANGEYTHSDLESVADDDAHCSPDRHDEAGKAEPAPPTPEPTPEPVQDDNCEERRRDGNACRSLQKLELRVRVQNHMNAEELREWVKQEAAETDVSLPPRRGGGPWLSRYSEQI